MILFMQIILSVILFFIINFIGSNSYSVGYMNLSVVYKEDKAPALNLALRVFTPVVYLIIVSAVFARFGFVQLNNNIWMVTVFYVIFRLFIVNIIIYNRFKLLNWFRESFCAIATIGLSYYVYVFFIRGNDNIFPNFAEITNEIWMLIILFIFQLLSTITNQSAKISKKRKEDYVSYKYNKFKNKYGKLIDKKEKQLSLKILLYSIMVYEDFNRPPVVRFIENILSKILRKNMTLGIMQVKSSRYITNEESIELAIRKINSALKRYKSDPDRVELYDYSAQCFILKDYNNSEDYVDEVREIYYQIKEKFYKKCDDRLVEGEII